MTSQASAAVRNVLVSCVSQKLSIRAPAASLYTSALFRLNMRYARLLRADRIFILSAKYGVLETTDVIEPYELTLNSMGVEQRRRWAADVLQSLRTRTDAARDTFVFLAGERYREYLVPHLAHVEVPMAGLTIGRQLQFLKRQLC